MFEKNANQFAKYILIVIFSFFARVNFAHLCHDPFRPDEHLILVPEKEVIELEDEVDFRIYIENTFSKKLESVGLFVENPAFDIEVSPQTIKELYPGERAYFLVKLKLKKGFDLGNYSLRISVTARSAELMPSIERLQAVVSKRIPQLIPQDVEPEVTIPQELKILPKEEPQVKEKTIKKKTKVTPIEIEEKTKESLPELEIIEEKQEVAKIPVEVKKIPFYKRAYFWILLILPIIAIFIWRRLRL